MGGCQTHLKEEITRCRAHRRANEAAGWRLFVPSHLLTPAWSGWASPNPTLHCDAAAQPPAWFGPSLKQITTLDNFIIRHLLSTYCQALR